MVIVILAGVPLNLTVGENGIFSKAKYAKEKYINEEYAEQEQLNELYAYLAKDSQVPNNTKDIEAGKSELTISNGTTAIDFAAQNTATSWTNASFSIKDGSGNTATGKITTKAGEIPYYHADYFTAHKLSQNMYTTNYVQSGLVTGTMWAAMLKFIGKANESIFTSSTWENYKDIDKSENGTNTYVNYTAGQGRYATVDSSNGTMTSAFKVSDGTYYYGMKTTAISEDVKQKNLYDVAGNLWEWTQETAYNTDTTERYMLRGCGFDSKYAVNPACYRGQRAMTHTGTNYGFRPVLYIKYKVLISSSLREVKTLYFKRNIITLTQL